ncbi:MAG TPA: glycosyltransferase, partial [Allocoleopsis sp.]
HINIGFLRNRLFRLLYPMAAALVVQTEQAREIMQGWFPSLKICVLPNAVSSDDPDERQPSFPLRTLAKIPKDARIIAGMGRLGPEKGFDLLIESFSRVQTQHPDWHLVIFGEGVDRQKLEHQVWRMGIQDHVHFTGLVYASRKYLTETDIFVLSSRYEGFPNVLLEAMSCGLPVVSFNCHYGPCDIIRHAYDGLLVEAENVKALEAAMNIMIDVPEYRAKVARNAREVTERFSVVRIMGLWEQLLVESGSAK